MDIVSCGGMSFLGLGLGEAMGCLVTFGGLLWELGDSSLTGFADKIPAMVTVRVSLPGWGQEAEESRNRANGRQKKVAGSKQE